MKNLICMMLLLIFVCSGRAQSSQQQDLKSYSKFDFIPGDKVIYFEDFSQDNVGDFPDKWNTNSSGEIVTIASIAGKWLKTVSEARYRPMIKGTEFPDNFTIEFDVVFKILEGRNELDIDIFSASDDKQLDGSYTTCGRFSTLR